MFKKVEDGRISYFWGSGDSLETTGEEKEEKEEKGNYSESKTDSESTSSSEMNSVSEGSILSGSLEGNYSESQTDNRKMIPEKNSLSNFQKNYYGNAVTSARFQLQKSTSNVKELMGKKSEENGSKRKKPLPKDILNELKSSKINRGERRAFFGLMRLMYKEYFLQEAMDEENIKEVEYIVTHNLRDYLHDFNFTSEFCGGQNCYILIDSEMTEKLFAFGFSHSLPLILVSAYKGYLQGAMDEENIKEVEYIVIHNLRDYLCKYKSKLTDYQLQYIHNVHLGIGIGIGIGRESIYVHIDSEIAKKLVAFGFLYRSPLILASVYRRYLQGARYEENIKEVVTYIEKLFFSKENVPNFGVSYRSLKMCKDMLKNGLETFLFLLKDKNVNYPVSFLLSSKKAEDTECYNGLKELLNNFKQLINKIMRPERLDAGIDLQKISQENSAVNNEKQNNSYWAIFINKIKEFKEEINELYNENQLETKKDKKEFKRFLTKWRDDFAKPGKSRRGVRKDSTNRVVFWGQKEEKVEKVEKEKKVEKKNDRKTHLKPIPEENLVNKRFFDCILNNG